MEDKLAMRFWKYVDRSSNVNGCWNWMSAVRNGYGAIGWKRKTLYAHRVSYELNIGPIPAGLFVLHHCDNRVCVRPKHLFLGTAGDNVHDMMNKGRDFKVRGEENGRSKLNRTQVRMIRALLEERFPLRTIAELFSVDGKTIRQIRDRKTWAHVE